MPGALLLGFHNEPLPVGAGSELPGRQFGFDARQKNCTKKLVDRIAAGLYL
jgi:hypothetical protein